MIQNRKFWDKNCLKIETAGCETKNQTHMNKPTVCTRIRKDQVLSCTFNSFYFSPCQVSSPLPLAPISRFSWTPLEKRDRSARLRSLARSLVALFGNPRRPRSPPIYAATTLLAPSALLPHSDHFCSFRESLRPPSYLFLFLCAPRTHTRLLGSSLVRNLFPSKLERGESFTSVSLAFCSPLVLLRSSLQSPIHTGID